VVGLVLGVVRARNGDLAPWSHNVRLLVLIVIVLPVVAQARRLWFSRAGRFHTGATSDHLWGWLVTTVTLVGAALEAQIVLEQWLARSTSAEVVGELLATVTVVHVRLVGPGGGGRSVPSPRARRVAERVVR
jgi:hypothetical protein